jgi:DNA-binding NarL/FixJ family response regulator
MEKTRLLLVDDQLLFAENLKTVLELRANDMTVLGIAKDGKEAVRMADTLAPDLILMDVRMPVMDGVEAAKIIREAHPQILILMLTTFDDDEYVSNALHHGAAGYLLKDIPPAELISAIRAVMAGNVLISQQVAQRLVEQAYHTQQNKKGPDDDSRPGWLRDLTEREKSILKLISRGCNNSEIAEQLNLAEQTVKNYVSVIYSKLGINDRGHAMKMGIDARMDRENG